MTDHRSLVELPLNAWRAEFSAQLHEPGIQLVEAEPGAGKSTLIPLWLLEEPTTRDEQIWLIQPRILPTRALARRLAALLGSRVGDQVGYQVPFDRRSSQNTRLLIMTPGIVLQRLLADPQLSGVSAVVLDEIHERAVQQDLAWVWLEELTQLREDLRLVLMSATPDPRLAARVSHQLSAPGRQFPVSTTYQPSRRQEPLPRQVLRALQDVAPDVTALVFLPGWREIEQCTRLLQASLPRCRLVRLHSRVEAEEQQQAIEPATGPRIILSTNIAESALTVPDVTLVVDSGLVRQPRFDQGTGVQRLETRQISQAAADQRRGRAGRVQSGHCVRLWSADTPLAAVDPPAIHQSDALPLALQLAHWGSPVADLAWPDPPNPLALQQANTRLRNWQMLDEQQRITAYGRQVSALGTHPRLAALLQHMRRDLGTRWPEGALALVLWLHFEPEGQGEDTDLLAAACRQLAQHRQWQQLAERWQRVLECRVSADLPVRVHELGRILASAWPDRIAHRQASGRYHLSSGISVTLPHLTAEWALVLTLNRQGQAHSGLGLGITVTAEQMQTLAHCTRTLHFHRGRWRQHQRWHLGDRCIREEQAELTNSELTQALPEHFRQLPPADWPWPEHCRRLLLRARVARSHDLLPLPDLDDASLQASLPEWLGPFLSGQTLASCAPEQLPWHEGLCHWLGHSAVQQLAEQVPDRVTLPSGRTVAVTLDQEDRLLVSGKLQEFFGIERFELAAGRIPLTVQLLSPAGRPLAVTADLKSFWAGEYQVVAREMRGRYPRHPWPEDPLSHPPTRATKKAMRDD